jgi:hypothetical protein
MPYEESDADFLQFIADCRAKQVGKQDGRIAAAVEIFREWGFSPDVNDWIKAARSGRSDYREVFGLLMQSDEPLPRNMDADALAKVKLFAQIGFTLVYLEYVSMSSADIRDAIDKRRE